MALEARNLSEAFRELRKKTKSEDTGRPLTQIEMGEMLKCSPSNISRIENPSTEQSPRDPILKRAAEAFSHLTTLEELVKLRDEGVYPPQEGSGGVLSPDDDGGAGEAP